MTTLCDLASKWRLWSRGANREESGWQSDFAEWMPLLEATQEAMVGALDEERIPDVELVWAAAEEGEEMIDFACDRLNELRPWLATLAHSACPSVRWQVYEALRDGANQLWAADVLRGGLNDTDAYARRRAALALAGYPLPDLAQIAVKLAHDPDPYTRRAAISLAVKCADASVLERLREVLNEDPEELVQVALLAIGPK